MSADARVDATTIVETRRLDLLRRIADLGGRISPVADPQAKHGYQYAAPGGDAENDLAVLARKNYLEARFFDRVSLCPKCDGCHLNVREICPSCHSAHLASEGLFHHFRCGYVGIPPEFTPEADGGYRCPKCNHVMHHLGAEYDRLGKAFLCRGCGLVSETPPVEALCLSCGARTPSENLVGMVVFSYVLTSRGAEAVRRDRLLSDDDEPVRVADVAVYRRTVILEFLLHHMKRLLQLNEPFSVMLVKWKPETDERNEESQAQWLTRLKGYLREVDLVGQLADSLHVVVLPLAKRREAEALRRRVEAELGPNSPLALSAAEIRERKDLAAVVAGIAARSDPE
jgi:RNA polymerase subunit RPABC4/transcription elongation factor Spt4